MQSYAAFDMPAAPGPTTCVSSVLAHQRCGQLPPCIQPIPDSGRVFQGQWVDDEASRVYPHSAAYRVIRNNCRYVSASRIMAGHSARPIGRRIRFSVARLRLIGLRCGTVSCTLSPLPFNLVFRGPPPPWLGRGIVGSERPNDLHAPATY